MLCCFPCKAYEGQVPVFATTPRRSLFAWGWSEYQLAPMEAARQAGRDAGGSVHQPLMMQMPMPMPLTVKSSTHPCLSMHHNYDSRVAAASNLQNRMGMHGVHACLYFGTSCACFFVFIMAVDLLAVIVVSFREKAQEAPLGLVAHFFFLVFFSALPFLCHPSLCSFACWSNQGDTTEKRQNGSQLEEEQRTTSGKEASQSGVNGGMYWMLGGSGLDTTTMKGPRCHEIMSLYYFVEIVLFFFLLGSAHVL